MALDWAGISGGLFTAAIAFGSIIFAGLFAALIGWMYREWAKYQQFECIIWKKDGFGNLVAEKDTAGIFTDRRINSKRLFLKKCRVGLPPDDLPYIQTGKKKVLYLYRTGLKNFKFIRPVVTEQSVAFKVGEEDVNWAINSYEAAKKTFYSSKWAEYAPMIMFVIAVIGIVVMMIFLLKKFDVIVEASKHFADATKNIAVAKATVV